MRLNSQKRLTNYKTSDGNMTLLVLVDTTRADYPLQREILYSALSHFGMPYAIFDLGYRDLQPEDLSEHSAVVIAQEDIGSALSSVELDALIDAVQKGVGLVNFDNILQPYGEAYREMLGVEYNTQVGLIKYEICREVVIKENEHYITHAQKVGAEHRIKMPLGVYSLKVKGNNVSVVAETKTGTPVILVIKSGQGKIVQFTIPPRLWLDQYLGHIHGLDDVFWKSIVWVSKKPFAMKAWPPLVGMRIDDEGHIKKPEDLEFLEIGNEFGWKIHLGLALRLVPPGCDKKIKELSEVGKAEFVPHSFDRNNSLFNMLHERDYTKEEMKKASKEIESFFERIGIKPGKVINNHAWGWGKSSLSYIKTQGMNYGLNPNLPSEHSRQALTDWQPYPYGSYDVFYDYLPEDPDIMMLRSYPTQEYRRVYLPNGKYLVTSGARFKEALYDPMEGNTTASGKKSNEVDVIVKKMAEQMKFLLDNLFYGGFITHTTYSSRLSLTEWRELFEKFDILTSEYKQIYANFTEIGDYAISKRDSHLQRAEVKNTNIYCKLNGKTITPTKLYIFQDKGEWIYHRFEELPTYEGTLDITFPIKR